MHQGARYVPKGAAAMPLYQRIARGMELHGIDSLEAAKELGIWEELFEKWLTYWNKKFAEEMLAYNRAIQQLEDTWDAMWESGVEMDNFFDSFEIPEVPMWDPEERAEESADKESVVLIKKYTSGREYIPTDILYAWFDLFQEMK